MNNLFILLLLSTTCYSFNIYFEEGLFINENLNNFLKHNNYKIQKENISLIKEKIEFYKKFDIINIIFDSNYYFEFENNTKMIELLPIIKNNMNISNIIIDEIKYSLLENILINDFNYNFYLVENKKIILFEFKKINKILIDFYFFKYTKPIIYCQYRRITFTKRYII